MKCQLVLQFAANSMADFDRFVLLETKLMEEVGETAVVDGHDFGLGSSIFLFSIRQAYQLVLNEGVRNDLRSAYRETNGEECVVLWPSHLTEFSVL